MIYIYISISKQLTVDKGTASLGKKWVIRMRIGTINPPPPTPLVEARALGVRRGEGEEVDEDQEQQQTRG
jgi:hypothetical protein